ncbi:MAG: dockerin type I repeat-containing protein [Clostridia bacterium]|nr:dockerin type I repeat-containing protein [Clostridia bacterium]MBR0510118.1 dockerin type I repeat-containing protein [Clostridia bacterium]
MKTKRLISILLALVLIGTCLVHASANMIGDVDGDGNVSASDARLALRYSVGLGSFTAEQREAADTNKDGFVAAEDARTILRMSVGLEPVFEKVLYDTAHQYFEYAASDLPPVTAANPQEAIYRIVSTWCAYYTLHDVFRPVLKQLGYNDNQIEVLAPIHYSKSVMAAALRNGYGYELPTWAYTSNFPVYVPSVLMDYYRTHPVAGTYYIFRQYFDDIITQQSYYPSENAPYYYPEVGDIVFISNKETTYVNGIPTVDHTGQIIQVNPDGTFVCTEGALIEYDTPDRAPRVRERTYIYNPSLGTFQFDKNSIVFVVAVQRPNLSIAANVTPVR